MGHPDLHLLGTIHTGCVGSSHLASQISGTLMFVHVLIAFLVFLCVEIGGLLCFTICFGLGFQVVRGWPKV